MRTNGSTLAGINAIHTAANPANAMDALDALPKPPASPVRNRAAKRVVPRAHVELMAVANAAAAKWTATPAITLLWTTAADFAAKAAQYEAALTGRLGTGAQRPSQTFTLRSLDAQITTATTEVKNYIKKKFKSAGAAAQYARYGIVKEAGNWRLPKDRNERLAAMQQMVTAIIADGFATEEYGQPFWAGMMANYTAALAASNATDAQVSTAVASKTTLGRELREILQSLRLALKANYPRTYAAEYRAWGMQREDY